MTWTVHPLCSSVSQSFVCSVASEKHPQAVAGVRVGGAEGGTNTLLLSLCPKEDRICSWDWREGHDGEQENKSTHGAKLWATNMGDIHEDQEECRCPLGGQGGREAEREDTCLVTRKLLLFLFVLLLGYLNCCLLFEHVGKLQYSAVIFRQLLLWLIQTCWSHTGTATGGRPLLFWLVTMFD